MTAKSEMWRKRHAIQIAAQLPQAQDDALAILAYARSLVEEFMTAPETREGARAKAPSRTHKRAKAQASRPRRKPAD